MFRCFARGGNGWSWCIRAGAEEIGNHTVSSFSGIVREPGKPWDARSGRDYAEKKRNRIVPLSFRRATSHVKLFAACGNLEFKLSHKSDRTCLSFASLYVWHNVIHGAPARVSRSSVSFDS